MPRINRSILAHDSFYAIRRDAELARGETKDCAVVAVAAATGKAYDDVYKLMLANGRKPGKGTRMCITEATMRMYGFKLTEISCSHFIEQYPKAHQILHGVTSHHPDRFKEVWQDGHTYLLQTNKHILTVRNGQNCDWSRGRALRVNWIYRVEKI